MSWKNWLALLAVLGVVAAVAIPQYADYTHRAQASEAVSLLGAAKLPLAEYFSERKAWPQTLGEIAGETSGKYTQSVAITKSVAQAGEIELTATMRSERVDRRVAGHTILMVSSDGGRNWTCKPGSMPAMNLPAACRN